MNLTKDVEAKFKKLGLHSCCELALIIPHSYEDLTLHKSIQIGKAQLIDATVESVFRAPNTIQITFYAHNLGHIVHGVLFRPKSYMMHQFRVGERDYFYGVIDCKIGNCSMTMPRKTTNIGAITPKYKSALRSDVMHRLITNNLSLQNLQSEGLKEEVAKEILKLHFPQSRVLNLKELESKTIDALKYLELFVYMKQLASKRRYFEPINRVEANCNKWISSLPFKLTLKQIETIEDIRVDFAKNPQKQSTKTI